MTNPQARASDQLIERNQLLMIANGSAGIIFGLIFGFFLMFNVLGVIEIWPFATFDVQVPGNESSWRAAHVGPIMNGLLCLGVGLALHRVHLSLRWHKFVVYGLIFTVWANINFYIFAVFGNARALTGGHTERFGEANIFDVIGLLPALVATLITPVCMFIVVKAALRTRKELYES